MKNYAIYGLFALMTAGFATTSCSDDDEVLVPSTGYVDNKFAVPDDATGPEADLRRQFYKDTGVFLMFDDLLSHEYVGKDAFGNDVYKDERIDFLYNLTSMGSTPPEMELLTDYNDMKAAAEIVKKYIYPRIEGGNLLPFSILPVKSIVVEEDNYPYNIVVSKTVSCWRCLGIAVGEWLELPEDEREQYGLEVLYDLISSKFTSSSDEAEAFCDLSYEYSGEYLEDLDGNWDGNDLSIVYECGFLSYIDGWWGAYLPYTSEDFTQYLKAVMYRDENDFMEEFGEYPLVVTKYNMIKDALISLGYKF